MNGPRLALVLLVATSLLPAQDLKEFEKRVTEFTLANGLHFTVVERHEAPVVSFHTFVNAGSADDPAGETGLAHMFEHMAFKGTESIGTRNWAAEKKALQAVEDVYDRMEAERNKGPKADQSKIDYLGMQLKQAIDVAQSYVESDEYTRIIEENGGVDLNADTSFDDTEYFCSLPSNRIELWFLLESQRFLHPVFREFYKERDVVQEENRMRNQPGSSGELLRDFVATAFEAFPYRNPPGGWPSDVRSLRRGMAEEFFEKYYVPANINIAIVGDVAPAQARRLAERYFGPMPARPLPPLIHTVEPMQDGPKSAIVESRNQPLLAAAYKRPDQYDKDDPVYEVIGLILSSGRTGLLYTGLVQQKKTALDAEAAPAYPSSRYPSLFAIFVAPAVGHTVEENQKALDDVLARLAGQKIDAQTLQRVKTKARAAVIRRLDSNPGLAASLAAEYGSYGDWRKLFTQLDDLNKVTAEDVERVARSCFVAQNRTVAFTVSPHELRAAGAGEGRP
ncbi:MAG: M16 family metallopeptidase [Bryobacteraceae bacterium]